MTLVTDFRVRGHVRLPSGAGILIHNCSNFMGVMYSPRAQCHH